MVVALGLSLILGGAAAARAHPASRPAALHRHRARTSADYLAAYRRSLKRSHPKGSRRGERAAPVQPEANGAPDVAFVTLTTTAEGTSFYVDGRRIGIGSTVNESLPPGYHRFQAVHPSGARWQKYLSFDAGEDRQLIIHW